MFMTTLMRTYSLFCLNSQISDKWYKNDSLSSFAEYLLWLQRSQSNTDRINGIIDVMWKDAKLLNIFNTFTLVSRFGHFQIQATQQFQSALVNMPCLFTSLHRSLFNRCMCVNRCTFPQGERKERVHCPDSPFENKKFHKTEEKHDQIDSSQSNTCKGNTISLKLPQFLLKPRVCLHCALSEPETVFGQSWQPAAEPSDGGLLITEWISVHVWSHLLDIKQSCWVAHAPYFP